MLEAVDADRCRADPLVVPLHPRFGLSLGGRIEQIDGVPYDVFIVPGLITMAMIQAAYANNSSRVFQARFDRSSTTSLAAPMRTWEVNLGLSLGGVVRALLIGVSLPASAAGRPAPRCASRWCSSSPWRSG